jgi:colicin import membrane protein
MSTRFARALIFLVLLPSESFAGSPDPVATSTVPQGASEPTKGTAPTSLMNYVVRVREAARAHRTSHDPATVIRGAEIEVAAAPNGNLLMRRLLRSSGSIGWDNALLSAIEEAGRLPVGEDGRAPPRIVIIISP